jgi:hypothetical protein
MAKQPLGNWGLAKLTKATVSPTITGKQIRKTWEVSSPTTQCNRLIGPFIDGTECYICGMAIEGTPPNPDRNNNNDSDSESKNGLNPECEHILPIAEAIIYLGLESPQFTNNLWYLGKDKLRQEYAWAHRACNQIKSDESFIGNDRGIYVVQIDKLKEFLRAIWHTKRKDSINTFVPKLHAKYPTEKDFIYQRIDDEKKPLIVPFQNICDYLNSFRAPNLLFLAGISGLVNIHGLKAKFAQKAQANTSGNAGLQFIKQLEAEKRRRRVLAAEEEYIKIYHDIVTHNKKTIGNDRYKEVYEEFGRQREIGKPYFTNFRLRLPDDLNSQWSLFTYISLQKAFLEIYKNQVGGDDRKYTNLIKKINDEQKKLGPIFIKALTEPREPEPSVAATNGSAAAENNTEMLNAAAARKTANNAIDLLATLATSGNMNISNNTNNNTGTAAILYGLRGTPSKKASKKTINEGKKQSQTNEKLTLRKERLNQRRRNTLAAARLVSMKQNSEGGRRKTRKIKRN